MTRDIDSKDLENLSGGAPLTAGPSPDGPRTVGITRQRQPPTSPADPTEGIDTDADGGDTVGIDQA